MKALKDNQVFLTKIPVCISHFSQAIFFHGMNDKRRNFTDKSNWKNMHNDLFYFHWLKHPLGTIVSEWNGMLVVG